MRMYTLHFGQGREHTQSLLDQAKGNIPYDFDGWDNGAGAVDDAIGQNAQIISHREIFERYSVKGGHGEYCLETWTGNNNPPTSCQLHTGGFGDLPFGGQSKDTRPFYLKFDFMYTHATGGDVLVLQRTKTGEGSEDFKLSLSNGFLSVDGSKHIDQPGPGFIITAWLSRQDNSKGSIFLEPNKWHEIQVFIQPNVGWDVSEIGPEPRISLGYYDVDSFVPAFQAYEDGGIFSIPGSETTPGVPSFPLQMDSWPANGHPEFPNTMLPGQDQTVFPPENLASGQYFYGDELGMVYVWVNGKIDIQQTTNMSNEQEGGFSEQAVHLGYRVTGSDSDDNTSSRFFYDNIIWNDTRDPSGSLPSKIFDPLFSSDTSLEWNPNYSLKFVAMEFDENFWTVDGLGFSDSRKHNEWLPEFPLGKLVPSGDPYFVSAPNRFGAPTDRMIPHGTKLTVVHVDWNGEEQDYTVNNGNQALYPDYDVDYAYQHMHPNESNPMSVNQDDPRLTSSLSGNKVLFYLKRPPATYGKQPFAGGPGLGGVKDYVPNISTDLGETSLPVIYRIWTCIQDHTLGASDPIDTQFHMIRVPSGVSGSVDYVSDNQCPGDQIYRAYTSGIAAITNGYSMADWPYNPVTGNPWTWDELNNLQIGATQLTHGGSNFVELYTIYLVVEHASSLNTEVSVLNTNLLEQSIADDISFFTQKKSMYNPGWRQFELGEDRAYYNRWDISPTFQVARTDRQTSDGQITIVEPRFSGVIEYDYTVKHINGEDVTGASQFAEHFDRVWVYTISGYIPANSTRTPFRNEVITDADGNYFTFLTYPVLQYNDKKFITDPGLSPLSQFPYILYDYNTLYVIPLTTHNFSPLLIPTDALAIWTDPKTQPSISGDLGLTWTINQQQNVFNFAVDPDSYFHPFSPSSVANHILTHPNESLDLTFPTSRTGHDYYFQAPDLPSGSVSQVIHLTEKLGFPELGIDNELYEVNMGLYQTTVTQAANDTGEGKFEFFSGVPGVDTLISGHTFGQDGTAGWHLNETTVVIPSGTRRVRFTFDAIRNTTGPKSPGGTLGGTSNFASFDNPFFIVNLSSGATSNTYHPADANEDNRITNEELAYYIQLWQSGSLPLGQAKDYLTKAERIWQSGVSSHFAEPSGGLYVDVSDGPRPENWVGSGSV